MTTQDLQNYIGNFKRRDKMMPVFFIGHGSPMNGIEDNSFTRGWQKMVKDIETPSAVLVISAHWLTKGTKVTAMDFPETIYDFGGFPEALYQVQYPAPGSQKLAVEIQHEVSSAPIDLDFDWGLDHGTWTVVKHMFPKADIPVLQLSIDFHKPAAYHYKLAQELLSFRQRGILVVGSGNIVHNLRKIDWQTSIPLLVLIGQKNLTNTLFKNLKNRNILHL